MKYPFDMVSPVDNVRKIIQMDDNKKRYRKMYSIRMASNATTKHK